MKQLIISLISLVCVLVANAQESKPVVAVTGNVTFLSMTNSTFTGGKFGDNPALRGSVVASYKGVGVAAMRNSDLLDRTTSANFFALGPSYSGSLGKFDLHATLECYFFDDIPEMNMVAPYVIASYGGVVNIETMVCYAQFFESKELLDVQMLAISKDYQGFTFKAYAWNVNWGGNKKNAVLEISKRLNHFKVSIFGHVNDLTREVSYFGAIRVGYSF